MATSSGEKAKSTIVIKRIKKVGHGTHGAAWKIAYADFVTAMMAFFLLMWLLGSTTEGDKKGIADFFNSPLKVALMGGSGSGDSSSILRGGGQDLTRSGGQGKSGDIVSQKKATPTLRRSAPASAATATGSCRRTVPTRRVASSSPAACPTRGCCVCRACRRAPCSTRKTR